MNNLKIKLQVLKPVNEVAKDLRSPKYRMRVAKTAKQYSRKGLKTVIVKELSYG
jgi:hypothetical protein